MEWKTLNRKFSFSFLTDQVLAGLKTDYAAKFNFKKCHIFSLNSFQDFFLISLGLSGIYFGRVSELYSQIARCKKGIKIYEKKFDKIYQRKYCSKPSPLLFPTTVVCPKHIWFISNYIFIFIRFDWCRMKTHIIQCFCLLSLSP